MIDVVNIVCLTNVVNIVVNKLIDYWISHIVNVNCEFSDVVWILLWMCNTKKCKFDKKRLQSWLKFNFLNRCSDGRSETADAKISSKRIRFDTHTREWVYGWVKLFWAIGWTRVSLEKGYCSSSDSRSFLLRRLFSPVPPSPSLPCCRRPKEGERAARPAAQQKRRRKEGGDTVIAVIAVGSFTRFLCCLKG
jgi:hypothetical protein